MPKPKTLEGRIEGINLSPHGEPEGILLATEAGIVQVNFEKRNATRLSQWTVGRKVRISAALEGAEEGVHPVYRCTEPAADVEGEVVRFNYARHGEVNGYVLADGVFVHVKPDGAKRYRVAVGDRLRASGERRHGSAADVIEANEVVRLRPRRAAP